MDGNTNASELTQVLTYVREMSEKINTLTTTVAQQAQEIHSLKGQLVGEVASLSTNDASLQTLVEGQSSALTNETLVRAKLVQGVVDEVQDLRTQHSVDHAHVIGLIESHHDDQIDAVSRAFVSLNEERSERVQGDNELREALKQNEQEAELYYTETAERLDQYDQALDDRTWDSTTWTMDNDVHRINWSLLSASQQWELELADYIAKAERQVNSKIQAIENLTIKAANDSTTALENSDIDRVIENLQGKVGNELLDNVLQGRIDSVETGLSQEIRDRFDAVTQEALARHRDREALNTAIIEGLMAEANERVDAIAREAQARLEAIELEALERIEGDQALEAQLIGQSETIAQTTDELAQAIVQEQKDRAEAILAEAKARAEALEDASTELQSKIDTEIGLIDQKIIDIYQVQTDQREYIDQEFAREAVNRQSIVMGTHQMAKDYAEQVSNEALAQATQYADSKVTDALAEAVAQSNTANSNLAQVVEQNRVTAEQASEAVKREAQELIDGLDDGLTLERQQRIEGDKQIVTELTAYKSTTDTTLAAAVEQLNMVTDQTSTTVERLQAIEAKYQSLEMKGRNLIIDGNHSMTRIGAGDIGNYQHWRRTANVDHTLFAHIEIKGSTSATVRHYEGGSIYNQDFDDMTPAYQPGGGKVKISAFFWNATGDDKEYSRFVLRGGDANTEAIIHWVFLAEGNIADVAGWEPGMFDEDIRFQQLEASFVEQVNAVANDNQAVIERVEQAETSFANNFTVIEGQYTELLESISQEGLVTTSRIEDVEGRLVTVEESTGELSIGLAQATESLNTTITNVSANTEAISALGAKFTTDYSDALAKIEGLSQAQADSNAASATQVENLETAMKAADAALTSKVGEVATSVSTLEESTASRFAELGSSLEATDALLDQTVTATANAQTTANTAVSATEVNASEISKIQTELVVVNGDIATKASTTALNAVDTRVGATETGLVTQGELISGLQSELSLLGDDVDTKASIAALDLVKTDIQEIEGGMASQAEQISGLQNSLTVVQQQVGEDLQGAINDLDSRVNTALTTKADVTVVDKVRTDLTAVDGRVTSNAEDISTLQNTVDVQGKDLATKATITALDGVKTSVTTLGNTVSSQGGRITGLENSVTQVNKDLATKATSAQMQEVNTSIGEIDGTLTVHTEQLTTISSSLETINGTLSTKLDADVIDDYITTVDANSAIATGIEQVRAAMETEDTALKALVNSETTARTDADTALGTRIDTVQANTNTELGKVNAAVASEQTARTTADTALGKRIDQVVATAKTDKADVTALVTTETTARVAGDKAVTDKVDALSASTTTELGRLNSAVTTEQTARTSADTALGKRIDAVVATATTDKADLNAQIVTVSEAMVEGDEALSTRLDQLASTTSTDKANLTALITTEQTSRTTADTALGKRIDQVVATAKTDKSDVTALVTAETTARTNADNALTTRINNLTTTVTNNNTTVTGKITNVEKSVTDLDSSVNTRIQSVESRLNTALDGVEGSLVESIAVAQDTADTAVTKANANAQTLSTLKTSYDAYTTKTDAALVSYNKTFTDADKALGSRITTLDTKVNTNNTAVTGRIQEVADSVTTLEGTMNTKTTELASSISALGSNKLDATAINNYYTKAQTKTEATTIAAGEVNKYKAALVIGGVNQLLNSEAERSSTATTRREYFMYEKSAHLKEFYEEYLGKDVTISFDLKVAVAGAVQVYCSNGTFHTFSASVTVAAANVNKWVRYSVTVKPVRHATSTSATQSAVEFFGTYDTGRIPYVRKVQLEVGNVATAWGPSPRDYDASFGNVAEQIQATADALETTDAEVTRLDGVTKTHSSNITSLQGSLATTNTNVSKKADTTALNALTTTVTTQGNNLSAVTSDVSKLTTSLATTNSNVSKKADSSTVNALTTRVTETEGDVAVHTEQITGIQGSLTEVDTKAGTALTNAAKAQTTANTAVTNAASAASRVDTLTARYEKSAIAGANLLVSSNVEMTYKADGAYPHATYDLGVEWETGQKYTLIWCATHKRATGDTTSSLAVYAGGGNQSVSSIVNLEKRINKVTFTKTTAGIVKRLHFYLLSKPANGVATVATIHWAVLVKGDQLLTEEWIPSAFDFKTDLAVTNATLSTAQTTLANADKALGTRIDTLTTTVANNDTAVKGQIKSVSDSLTTFQGTTNTKISTLEGKMTTVEGGLAKAATAAAVTALTTRVTNAEGVNTTQGTAITKLTNDLATTNGNVSKKASTEALEALDSIVKEQGNTLTAEAAKVSKLQADLATTNTNVAAKANTSALNAVTTRVTAAEGKITTYGSDISTLKSDMTAVKGNIALKADATALSGYLTKVDAESATSQFGQTLASRWNSAIAAAEPTREHVVDARTLDVNKYYCVRIVLPANGKSQTMQLRTELSASVNGKPSWSTHASGFTCTLEWTATGSGWGGHAVAREVHVSHWRYTTDEKAPFFGLDQYTNSSSEVVFVRGGGRYLLVAPKGVSVTLLQADLTVSSQTIPANKTFAASGVPKAIMSVVSSQATLIADRYTKAEANSAITSQVNAAKSELNGSIAQHKATIDTWVERNKVEAAMVETLAAELVPHMAGNTDLFADVEINVGYQGVITALADADAALMTRVDQMQSRYDNAFAEIGTSQNIITTAEQAAANMATTLRAEYKAADTATANNASTALTNALKNYTTTSTLKTDYITKADANSAIASATTTLKSEVNQTISGIKLDSITIPDTRSVNQAPQWYWTNYGARMVNEFKTATAIGLTTALMGQTYCMLTTYVYYKDATGGAIKQVATGNTEDKVQVRYSTGSGTAATWTAWKQQGSTEVGKLSTTITENAATVNGIRGIKTVTIDNNGVLSGYGLVSELVNGRVTSAFGVNADQFYVGSPSTGKKVFSVVNGVTVINDGVIGNLSANKITTGTMHGDRITAGTIKVNRLDTTELVTEGLSALSAKLGTFTSSSSDGSRTVISGSKIEVFYPGGQVAVRLGIF